MSNCGSITIEEGCKEITLTEGAAQGLEVYVNVLTGPKGDKGEDGEGFVERFEALSKNLRSWNYTLNYTSEVLTSIVYVKDSLTITKTLNYTTGNLTSVVLSGDVPSGIELTKTLGYESGILKTITYS